MASHLNLLTPKQVGVPNDLYKFAKQELILGVKKSNHPFHLCTLSTVDSNGHPHARTVVSRGVDNDFRHIRIHSDKRAQKNRHIKDNDHVCALFYSPAQKLQVRLNGVATVIDTGESNIDYFATSSPVSQLCYGFPVPPGHLIDEQSKEIAFREINLNQLDHVKLNALENFSHIMIDLKQADILWLNHLGHIRISGDYHNNQWDFKYVVA
jgi:pyridoxamine 5'-phosphate oxidase